MFVERLLEICESEKCKLVFAGHDVELLPLAENRERFESIGAIPVVSSPKIIRICDDKLATVDFLRDNGFPAPHTERLRDVSSFDFPAVLKPQRGGARSRGTFVIRSEGDLEACRAFIDEDNCVVQEYVEGDEYTCGTVNLGGKCAGVIAMRRTLRAGDTYKAFVERDEHLETTVRDIVNALVPFGACNAQLRVRDGEPLVFEINARCTGTTAARALAGFNEPAMIADFLLRGISPEYSIREISILRYWQELVVENAQIQRLSDTGYLRGNGVRL
jgi:carbamoyl-phosphate synthase large subunit